MLAVAGDAVVRLNELEPSGVARVVELALRMRIVRRLEFRGVTVVARLLDRAAQTGATGLDDVLGELESMRFRFWKPSLMRVALKARGLRSR